MSRGKSRLDVIFFSSCPGSLAALGGVLICAPSVAVLGAFCAWFGLSWVCASLIVCGASWAICAPSERVGAVAGGGGICDRGRGGGEC